MRNTGSGVTSPHRWTELVSRTLSDALNEELERRGCSMKDAAAEMNTTVQNVSRWAHPVLAVEPNGDQIDAVMDFLGVDDREMGALVIATKRKRSEMRRTARRRGL